MLTNLVFMDAITVSGKPIRLAFQVYCQVAIVVRNLPANAGDTRDLGSISGLGQSPGGGYGNPLQHSCLENLIDSCYARFDGEGRSWRNMMGHKV